MSNLGCIYSCYKWEILQISISRGKTDFVAISETMGLVTYNFGSRTKMEQNEITSIRVDVNCESENYIKLFWMNSSFDHEINKLLRFT